MVGINCVFAFLLNIPDTPNPRSRMAVVGNRPQDNYMLFHMTQGQEFPVLTTKEIFMMPYRKSRKNTLLTSYCSFTLGLSRIFQSFEEQLSRVKKIEDLDFKRSGDGYELCKKTIWEWWETKKLTEKNKINPIGMDILVTQRICSPSQITRLGREDKLRLIGDYNCFAPYLTRHVPVINADLRLKLKDIVWGSQAFIGKGKGPAHALVWYQGNLHVFQWRERNASRWYLVTKIGTENKNGKAIFELVMDNSKKLIIVQNKLEKHEMGSPPESYKSNIQLAWKHILQIHSAIDTSDNRFDTLRMERVDGKVACFEKDLTS
ncbi:BgTH12-02162 [Blumeria graminis f. sp. triticale]|uniref:BgtE-5705 n=3 Tax=Blumeria graminis TaxID=34373 RepID=A0A9X9QCH7_BLUGR|nr:BgTH12-02162 [Blumeria graminis f. sp. triticale]VDB85860.1 BgtE-5705 [Blumeria graminis f. sp. tritici]